jgi:hypothetical protein
VNLKLPTVSQVTLKVDLVATAERESDNQVQIDRAQNGLPYGEKGHLDIYRLHLVARCALPVEAVRNQVFATRCQNRTKAIHQRPQSIESWLMDAQPKSRPNTAAVVAVAQDSIKEHITVLKDLHARGCPHTRHS